ncbi:glycoside hydrolase family 18 [Fusarium subglutinans]|uniref:chitinase n=1 Tax=Gibberella subglutinans TaxID=42677 RepID=A0A8H5Q2D1_GIBSU|nr:glycoside hydrolase family 18 [Fusarium subglutinans]KAF5606321.1 glycoside hydrolase family 18 [Fusarium subglutinans]
MWLSNKSLWTSVLLGTDIVQSAIKTDGSKPVDPVNEDDPSPISDINTYYPDQHDCPPPCADYSNPHSWITYLSAERLERCKEPMLLQLSVSQPVDQPGSTVIIRSCTYGPNSTNFMAASQSSVDNPKKSSKLYQGGSLRTAAACAIDGEPSDVQLLLDESGDKTDGSRVLKLLEGLRKFFELQDNCDENFLFSYHQQTIAGIFIGNGLGKPTAKSAIEAISQKFRPGSSPSELTTIELCGGNRKREQVFGISINAHGNLAEVQKQLMDWSEGKCALKPVSLSTKRISGVKMFDIIGMKGFENTEDPPSTPTPEPTSRPQDVSPRFLGSLFSKRATCKHIQVVSGDSCAALAARCNIRGNDFLKYNPQKNLCSTLKENDYVCCSSGDPFKPEPPKPSADGTCATHLIKDGDTCDSLARKAGVTIQDLEKFNKGRTWAWTDCKDLLLGYNMCLGPGNPPMPPPQEGAECGPLVPGTKRPTNKSVSIADLNPCPLKACCSNWGFCGVFPAHCTDNSPEGGGPGSKKKGFQTSCVSNCGNKIKQNSGPPSAFQRIGYYEAYGMNRDCLWLNAKDANTDGSYTHIHWAFASIDPNTWKPVIKEGKSQWADFKKLKAKRIVSLGGWADSTEPGKYNIIRSAIINNRETFATNLAKFADEEGIDGIDIDWEYPGAPDIEVGGKPIGQKRDGLDYLRFLTVLRSKMNYNKLVSMAAPASYWYLKAFPIDKIAEVVDYIVYMTYDLHGQWDYGNPNAFDQCESGKCIRSHVTKAGVPNNKIFVGEASYGRSFHMAQDGCWKPNCEFTGSRIKSDAAPGRCTKTGGYLAFAEIMELLRKGVSGMRAFYDSDSESDIMLYKGDYISYMTPKTKDSRRDKWKGLNFAGSIDWAVDLQKFTSVDFDAPVKRPDSGEGCIQGEDKTDNTGSLCTGTLKKLPSEDKSKKATAYDEEDADLNRLCRPNDEEADGGDDEDDGLSWNEQPNAFNYTDAKWQNAHKCYIYKDTTKGEDSLNPCKSVCQPLLDEAEEEGRTSNYGCVGLFPLDEEIPWQRAPGSTDLVAPGQCNCDNFLVNYFADTIIEALPIIAQIGCYILMASLKFVLDAGTSFIPGRPGKVLDAGLDMAATAAQTLSYIYPKEEKPEEAFGWWFSVCGGTDLVPDEIKQIFDVLNSIPDGMTSFKPPRKIKKGSGKKGDEGNPRAPTKPRPKPQPPKKNGGGGISKNKRCNVKPSMSTRRLGAAKNTLRLLSCDKNSVTQTRDLIVTSMSYAANAKPLPVTGRCLTKWGQACYHYSSAIKNNPSWSTITCPQEAATTTHREDAKATAVWKKEHDPSWLQQKDRKHKAQCDMDEYPPAYLLTKADPAWQFAGKDKRGQRLRYLPHDENAGAALMWTSICLKTPLGRLSDSELWNRIKRGTNKQATHPTNQKEVMMMEIVIGERPEFSISYDHERNPKPDAALADNPCLPDKLAVNDPGFALLKLDEWYDNNPKGANGARTKWDYSKPYVKKTNGD